MNRDIFTEISLQNHFMACTSGKVMSSQDSKGAETQKKFFVGESFLLFLVSFPRH